MIERLIQVATLGCGLGLALMIATVPLFLLSQAQVEKLVEFEPTETIATEGIVKDEPGYTRYGNSVLVPQTVTHDQTSIIRWRSDSNVGASPLAVLRATKDQMEREQQSDLGSDANAKALVLVMQAVAELQDKQTAMPDGTPIIQ